MVTPASAMAAFAPSTPNMSLSSFTLSVMARRASPLMLPSAA